MMCMKEFPALMFFLMTLAWLDAPAMVMFLHSHKQAMKRKGSGTFSPRHQIVYPVEAATCLAGAPPPCSCTHTRQ